MKNPSGRDAKDSKNKASKNQKLRRGGPKDDDDVDENGNIEGLIDYEYEDESEADSELSLTKEEIRHLKKYGRLPESIKENVRSPRTAAIKAREQIRKKLKKEDSRNKTPSTTDSTYVDSEDERPRKKAAPAPAKKGFSPKKKPTVVVEEDEEDGETLGSEDTDDAEGTEDDTEETEAEDDVDDEDADDEEDDVEDAKFKGISISFGGGGGFEEDDRMIPRRHNMKKESAEVRRFVEMVTKPVEENTIDDQIDQFKALESPKKRVMLEALEKRSEYVKKEEPLMFRLLQMKLSPETMAMVMNRYNSLNTLDVSSGEYYKLRAWMEKLVAMPLGLYKEMPVRLEDGTESCAPFMSKARKCLDEAIYGQDDAKLQIMQFIASKIANPSASGLSLLLMGPPGIGKTSLIKNGIAKALEWPFQFISLGGDSDSTTFTGHQFVYEGSHCGRIANCLAQAKSMSMILMFDELDKISATPKGEEIQNLLVHMTDPVQNMEFEDKYLSGIPLDLSRAMLVFSGNDMNKIDKVLLDRMVVVQLQGYQPKDKINIAEQFLLPGALKEVNLMEKVAISRDILQHVIDNYAKEETGVRELKRCIGQIVQRINMLRMFNVKELPFHIPNFNLPFVLKKEHVDLFLKKKEVADKVPFGMYI
jgi:hypothetical protein